QVEAKVKMLEQADLAKDHEIKSLQVTLTLAEAALTKAEHTVHQSAAIRQEVEVGQIQIEALRHNITLLEDELDGAERNVKEKIEKLRQVDLKAEHFERQARTLNK
ncbi:tropomyosin, partial [Mycena olivaceomarginata]